MKKSSFYTQLILIVMSVGFAHITQNYVDFSRLDRVFSTLQNISAAVFTLSGLWIAYMYPEAIAYLTKSEKLTLVRDSQHVKEIEKLVLIIFTSAFVIIGTLIHDLFTLIIQSISKNGTIDIVVKYFSLSWVLYLSLNQSKAILSVMISNLNFVNRLHKISAEKEADKDL